MTTETKQIESLTPEQEAQLPVYRDKWLEIGLKTGPCDRKKVETAASLSYERAGLPFPSQIYWEDSPYAGIKKVKSLLDKDQADINTIISNACYGQQDASWLAFYNFFGEQCGIKEVEKLDGLMGMAEGGWWWPLDEAVVLTDRPTELHRDDEHRLHNEFGPCIAYADDFKMFAWHGIVVDEHVIVAPETITVAEIEDERDQEIKRVKILRMGTDRYMLASGCEEVHKDDWGTLLRKEMGDGEEAYMVVKVVNSSPEPDGTYKDYFIEVHPELRLLGEDGSLGDPQPLTALNAIASTHGVTGEEYLASLEVQT